MASFTRLRLSLRLRQPPLLTQSSPTLQPSTPLRTFTTTPISNAETKKPQPKITHPDSHKSESDLVSDKEAANEDVRKHNEEMAQGHERTGNRIGDDGRVEKGFWGGKKEGGEGV